ncbi:MAG: DUF2520 domain-containing protein [Rikenellaceae bacterium]
MNVVIIGSGNVASALVEKLAQTQIKVVQVFARNMIEGSKIASKVDGCSTTNDPRALCKADMYIVAVSDGVISTLISKIDFAPDDIVVHTAGSVSMDEIGVHVRNKGVLYPLQTFSKGIDVNLKTTPFLIEANNILTLKAVRAVAGALSDNIFEVNSEQRMRIHVAAVFACNFINHMLVISEQLCSSAKVDNSLLRPLVEQTIEKAMQSERAVDVQTGPAVRNDFRTKTRHLEMLDNEPVLKNIYKILSQNIWETSKKI